MNLSQVVNGTAQISFAACLYCNEALNTSVASFDLVPCNTLQSRNLTVIRRTSSNGA